MAKRAVLFDINNEVVAHLTYAEMDGYIVRGLVERLTPVKASTHKFRLLDLEAQRRVNPEVFERLEFDQTSLTASVSRANAGEADCIADILWARRRVRRCGLLSATHAHRAFHVNVLTGAEDQPPVTKGRKGNVTKCILMTQ